MRWLGVMAAFALAALPSGLAEPYILEDAVGDGIIWFGPNVPPQDPPPGFGAIDLVSLQVTETPAAFTIALTFQRAGGSEIPFIGRDEAFFMDIDFVHGEQRYRAEMYPSTHGLLWRLDAVGDRRPAGEFNVTTADDRTSFVAEIPRTLLFNSDGAIPGVGSRLESFAVRATGAVAAFGAGPISDDPLLAYWSSDDLLPGPGHLPFVGAFGLEQRGVTRLTSTNPTRASNGEAATFVFPVRATNVGPQEETFQLSWIGVPSGWTVSVANPTFDIGPGVTIEQNLLVTTPFGHGHGTFEDVRVELRAESDPESLGQLDLGIRYHEVPQPAGHHDWLYLHTRHPDAGRDPATGQLYSDAFPVMNTLEQDSEDLATAVPADTFQKPADGFHWLARLAPSLDIGMEFEPGREGTLALPLSSPVPQQGAVVSARLFLDVPRRTGAEEVVLARAGPSPATAMQPGQPVVFELPLLVEGTRHPYVFGSELYLQVVFESIQPTAVAVAEYPRLEPGGRLQLPLLEYRDALLAADKEGLALLWTTAGPTQRVANPGGVVVYEATLSNGADEAVDVDLTLNGVNVGWATLPAPHRLHLASGAGAVVKVVVAIPTDAGAFDVSDLILAASPVGAIGKESIIRFLTEVDTQGERADDAEAAAKLLPDASTSDAPAAGPALLLAALLAVALLARRLR